MTNEFRIGAISYLGLTWRDVLVFLKNKAMVFFSLLASLIVLALYLLFLKDFQVDSVVNRLEGASFPLVDIKGLVDANLISGILGTSMVTIAMSTLSIMVDDRERKVDFDCAVTIKEPAIIVLAYITSSFLITFLMTLAIGLIGMGIIGGVDGIVFEVGGLGIMVGTVAIGSLSAVTLMALVISFIQRENVMSAIGTIVSTLVGFIIGAYGPLSILPKAVQTIANLFPASNATGILRQTLLTPYINKLATYVPIEQQEMWKEEMEKTFGTKVNMFGNFVGIDWMWAILVGSLLAFIVIDALVYSKVYRSKQERQGEFRYKKRCPFRHLFSLLLGLYVQDLLAPVVAALRADPVRLDGCTTIRATGKVLGAKDEVSPSQTLASLRSTSCRNCHLPTPLVILFVQAFRLE